METKVNLDLNLALNNKERDFKQELDDFYFGGFVEWIRRDEDGCYVLISGEWVPVVDWYKPGKLPGGRDLTHLARYFYNLGRREAKQAPGGGENLSSDR